MKGFITGVGGFMVIAIALTIAKIIIGLVMLAIAGIVAGTAITIIIYGLRTSPRNSCYAAGIIAIMAALYFYPPLGLAFLFITAFFGIFMTIKEKSAVTWEEPTDTRESIPLLPYQERDR